MRDFAGELLSEGLPGVQHFVGLEVLLELRDLLDEHNSNY